MKGCGLLFRFQDLIFTHSGLFCSLFLLPLLNCDYKLFFSVFKVGIGGGELYNKDFSAFALFHLIKLKGC